MLSPQLVFCNERVFIMVINKVVKLYREACELGLSFSLLIHHINGQESFSLSTIPGPDLAGRPAHRRRRPRGGHSQRRCGARSEAPALPNQLPSLQSRTVQYAKRPSVAAKRTVAAHSDAEFARLSINADTATESDAAATAGKAAPATPSAQSVPSVVKSC